MKKTGEHELIELCPLLPEHPKTSDLIGLSKKGAIFKLIELFSLYASFVFPTIGYGLFAWRAKAAYGNLKKAKKLEEMLKS